jgi:hypothetical protein
MFMGSSASERMEIGCTIRACWVRMQAPVGSYVGTKNMPI